jgi:hypothetical protein
MKKRFIASLLTALLIVGVTPVGANAEWREDSNGKWYSNGDSWYTGWHPIDGKFYYFNNNGYMVTNSNIEGVQIGNNGVSIQNDAANLSSKDTNALSAGEKWIVDGQWEFTINSVKTTKERNQFSDKKPAQVVIINYSYKNLGYSSKYMDLYFSNFTVVDEKGEVADSYPANITSYPKQTPIGASCSNAQIAYGLANTSSTITIQIEEYTSNASGSNIKEKATFKVQVQ